MSTLTIEANQIRQPKQRTTKNTRQKEAILRVLNSTASHPTAAWIYDQVRREMPRISLGTVYRDLRQMAAQGRISELQISGGCKRFDANTSTHYHFLCDRCGQVFDLAETVARKIDSDLAHETEFKISQYQLQFHGLCNQCQGS